jgi:hypothetical protein
MNERVFDDNDRLFVEEFGGDLVRIFEFIFGNDALGWFGVWLGFFIRLDLVFLAEVLLIEILNIVRVVI